MPSSLSNRAAEREGRDPAFGLASNEGAEFDEGLRCRLLHSGARFLELFEVRRRDCDETDVTEQRVPFGEFALAGLHVGVAATPERIAWTYDRLVTLTEELFVAGDVEWRPGARAALRTVRGAGLPTALVTNSLRLSRFRTARSR